MNHVLKTFKEQSVAAVACVCLAEETFIYVSRSQSHVLLHDILHCL